MTLEHENFHAEVHTAAFHTLQSNSRNILQTLLYMLLRRAGQGTLPPPGFTAPPWATLSSAWDSAPLPESSTVTLGPETLVLGHDDSESNDDALVTPDHEFGWDNEHGKREVQVDQFKVDWRPISNGDFYNFYKGKGHGKVKFPEGWVEIDGKVHVSAACRFSRVDNVDGITRCKTSTAQFLSRSPISGLS